MQALKGLVIGLGILIVVGMVLLAYGFYVKINDPDFRVVKERASDADPETATSTAAGFGEARISLPNGCSVVEMRPAGDRLYLRTGPAGACERIVVVDVATGRVLGTLKVQP